MSSTPPPPAEAVDQLLAELDPLAHPDRMRRLAAWTKATKALRQDGGPNRLRPLLTELDTRGAFGRTLAGVAATIAEDVEFLAPRLTDPDPAISRQALKAALHLRVPDEVLAAALTDAPAVLRHRLTTLIVARRRTALAERLLPAVRQSWGDAAAARLLPGCGPEAVARLLPGLFLAVSQWRNLARRHPDLLLDEVARQLAELPEPARDSWWRRNAEVLAALAGERPERVLELLERHCPPRLPYPVQRCLGRLLTAAPGRTIRLITPPERAAVANISRSALTRVARLDPPELPDLARAWSGAPLWLARLLRALPPSRREACYDRATADRDLSHSELSVAVLDALPRRRAQAEARRMAAQAAERGEAWSVVLAHVAHLPVAEARPQLLAATRRPAAADRALAYPLLVRNAARSGEATAVGELLDELLRLRNEQDPVRSPALVALAAVPPALFTGSAAAALERIVTDAVEARDTSWPTRQALSQLALGVLREQAVSGEPPLVDWALATLRQLSATLGSVPLGRLDTALRRGQEVQVLEALRPWLAAGADRLDYTLTFALAEALGRRAHRLPELQELLWQAVRSGNNATVRQAVRHWLADPATRGERAARLLELEPSAAVLPPVLEVLARRRTDLLDTVLADHPPYGRFLTEGTRWLPPVDGIECWVPRQQAAAARLLAGAAADASLPRQVRAGHLRALVAVPELGFAAVRRHVDSRDTVLAEAALAALVRTDRPAEALPVLLAQAGNDRARVALYVAGRAAGFVAPSRLAPALRAALLPGADGAGEAAGAGGKAVGGQAVGGQAVDDQAVGGQAVGGQAGGGAKVTSRKELVRLVARLLPVDTAVALLTEAHDLPGQHRDVRAAAVAAAVGLLPSPAAWRLLDAAATGTPAARSELLRTRPLDLPAGDRPRYAALVAEVAGGDHRETAHDALELLAGWSPWYPEAEELLAAVTVDLANRSSWRTAASGLAALATGGTGRRLSEALALLLAFEAADADGMAHEADAGLDAAIERDRPARQRIDHLAARLAAGLTDRPSAAALAAADAAAELLGTAADFVPHTIRLQTAALDLDGKPDQLLDRLDRLAARHADRPVLAARTAEALRNRLNATRRPGDPAVLLDVTDRLTTHGACAHGLFAVGLTHALGPRTGWPQEWRALLRALRRHPHPDVREAALTVRTATE
ncbi:hypothetical protein [Kitasatospora sp. LaBMicrA B282]|uniref:hypothetical protein n=1 Tax=Kitasatospora sp. LaBMicrA B282 TaxID=3420949 RepID=UPI003D0AEA9A